MNQPMPFNIGDGMHWGVFIWILAVFSGTICHSKQCTLADYYRNIHLYFLKGKSGSELTTSGSSVKYFTVCRGRKLLVENIPLFYGNYTRQQENDSQFPAILCVGKGKVW